MKRREALAVLAGAMLSDPIRAQPQARKRLGMLLLVEVPPLTDPFFSALRGRGWVVGKNLEVESRVTAPEQGRASEIARELLANGSDLIVTVGTANAVAARSASKTVPIVMLGSGYPVEVGLAKSLRKPAGNVTGISVYAGSEIFGKYVALFRDLVPQMRELGIFWGYAPPAFPERETEIAVGQMRSAADVLGIGTRVWMNPDERALDKNLAELINTRVDGLFVSAGGAQSVPGGIAKVAAYCEKRRLPTVCDVAGVFFHAGGVLSYSPDFGELGARAASFVDRILRGAKAGDLPIEQPTRFELVVNMKRASSIGMTVPASLLLRADRVIE